jgi:5-methylthioadenosine/S-adenosylhomocysteine deaminase
VTDVMVNGKWLMQANKLPNIDEDSILRASQDYANKIDTFLIARESSVLSKLVAIGGTSEEESFEIQSKVRVTDLEKIEEKLKGPEFTIVRTRHYKEYDDYFFFADIDQGILRYREDDFIGANEKVESVRSRLTLIGPSNEGQFGQEVLLSRSRYLAPATQSLRFYREYFKPNLEKEIEKDRLRFLVKYENTEFFINLDRIVRPDIGSFIEIKSRTWSKQDAENKAELVARLLQLLGADPEETTFEDYIEMVR